MNPTQDPSQSATSYYTKNRKRSFFYSRISVITSMVVLVIALGINIFALYSQSTSTIQSRASNPTVDKDLLPALPIGCDYKQTPSGLTVVCATPQPTQSAVSLNVELPKLPPECSIQTTATGNRINCTKPVPIPTAPVTLPVQCIPSKQPNVVTCSNNNQATDVTLPTLPEGCSYALVSQQYYVTCVDK